MSCKIMKKMSAALLILTLLASASGCLRSADGESAAADTASANTAETDAAEGAATASQDTVLSAGTEEEQKSFADILAAYENGQAAEEQAEAVPEADDNASVSSKPYLDSAGTLIVPAEGAATVIAVPAEGSYQAVTAEYSVYDYGNLAGVALFTERDLTQNVDLSQASAITLKNDAVIDITKEGIYVLTGTADNCTVRVRAGDEDKVQLVLAGVDIANDDFPAVYVLSADKVFITTAEETVNSLSVTGAFRSDSENGVNTDAVIFSKEDLVLNGLGSLAVKSPYGNGITTKDDFKATGGTWSVISGLDAIEANDSMAVCGGVFEISSNKDGLHCENDEDDSMGWIWIGGGTLTINAKSDGIQGTSFVQVDGGTLTMTASEGIEGTYVQINDGVINIYGSDDGINASRKSSAYNPTIEINGGDITVEVGPGDTDGIDSNGDIIVNGGIIKVTAFMSSFDYEGTASFNGGQIYVNGQQVDQIPQSMMGGGHGGGGFGGGDFGGGDFGGGGIGGWGGFGGYGGGGRGGRG